LYYPPADPENPPPSLHDALPIYEADRRPQGAQRAEGFDDGGDEVAADDAESHGIEEPVPAHSLAHHLVGRLHRHPDEEAVGEEGDRKSTRLNSSHVSISYAVFCL